MMDYESKKKKIIDGVESFRAELLEIAENNAEDEDNYEDRDERKNDGDDDDGEKDKEAVALQHMTDSEQEVAANEYEYDLLPSSSKHRWFNFKPSPSNEANSLDPHQTWEQNFEKVENLEFCDSKKRSYGLRERPGKTLHETRNSADGEERREKKLNS